MFSWEEPGFDRKIAGLDFQVISAYYNTLYKIPPFSTVENYTLDLFEYGKDSLVPHAFSSHTALQICINSRVLQYRHRHRGVLSRGKIHKVQFRSTLSAEEVSYLAAVIEEIRLQSNTPVK